jgi:hypothetical protein
MEPPFPQSEVKLSRLLLLALCLLTFFVAIFHGAYKPFWFDELSTVHIAHAGSWAATFHESQTLDLMPPLQDCLTRLSFQFLGPNELAGRMPSVFAFLLAVGSLFLFIGRRFSPWFAAFGALLFVYNKELFYFATESRAYALQLGFAGLALLGYDSISRTGGTWRSRLLLFAGLCGMLLAHVFSIFVASGFVVAELVRSWRHRRIDIASWIAVLLPFACCILYLPLIHSHSETIYVPMFHATILGAFRLYLYFFLMPILPVIALAVFCLAFMRKYPESSLLKAFKLTPELMLILLDMLAMPVTVCLFMLWKAPGGGYFPRYAVLMHYPLVILLTGVIAWRSRERRSFAVVLVLFVLLFTVYFNRSVIHEARVVLRHGLLARTDQASTSSDISRIDPTLPLVANSGLDFMEADYYLSSADLTRYYYVTDPAEALRVTRSNALEGIAGLKEDFHLRGNIVPRNIFLSEHKEFLVIGDIDGTASWFLQSLLQRGYTVRYLGNYDFVGKKETLWKVSS